MKGNPIGFAQPQRISLIIAMVLLVTVFAACKVTQPYKRPADLTTNNLYRNTTNATDTTNMATLSWKELFKDPLLQSLIQEGIENNLDLKTAAMRIQQAEANLRQSKLAFFPSLNLTATGEAIKPAATQSANTQVFEMYGSSSWELDLWGKLKSSKRAALASLMQSDAYKQAVQTQLVADIATNYYALMGYDAQLKITMATLANRKKDAETMKILKESDVVTGAAVVQSQANRFSVEVTIPDIEQNIQQTENAISILLGRAPDAIKRDSLANQTVFTDLKTGVPSQLLANRPDVREAEYQFRNSFELVNVAKTYFYPALSITGQTGLFNNNLSDFFKGSSFFANVIGGIAQPVFNNGLNKQRLAVAQAQQEASLIAFKQSLLNAGLEVSNALFSYQAAARKITIREQQIAFLQKSVDYTKQLLKYTTATNYTDVLTSEQSLLAAQLSGISDKLQQLQAVVALYRSLGGGWK
ncbi:TolC family protein [Pedobacter sp. KR3-3]|uniref:TolC family protein n=1 Tax=Pedobacter albus TaxID=3113905 RepID=A0ABU7I3E4_9SPHI|nr:TolC family protein [Pedobacter sp. KR3-3]MEE1943978.1 TolC family protein [Pedobacter sp. KR3-3]